MAELTKRGDSPRPGPRTPESGFGGLTPTYRLPTTTSPTSGPISPTYSATGTPMDPTTGREVTSGPNGEGGWRTQADAPAGAVSWTQPGGRVVWYVPGQFIQNGNRIALGLAFDNRAQSLAPGANPTALDYYTREDPETFANDENRDARAFLEQTLATYGLSALRDWAWEAITDGASPAEVLVLLRGRPEYAQRFPAMAALGQSGRALSEGQYIDMERAYANVFHEAGIGGDFYDQPADFAALFTGDVSPAELQTRVRYYADTARQRLADAPDVADELETLYGLDYVDLASYLIDPTKTLARIETQFGAARAGTAARLGGYDPLNVGEAERVGALGLGDEALRSGFSELASLGQVLAPLPGEEEPGVERQEALSAAFESNSAARERIERRRAQRQAAFGGGGAFASAGSATTQ